jgi:hypothetical protein
MLFKVYVFRKDEKTNYRKDYISQKETIIRSEGTAHIPDGKDNDGISVYVDEKDEKLFKKRMSTNNAQIKTEVNLRFFPNLFAKFKGKTPERTYEIHNYPEPWEIEKVV